MISDLTVPRLATGCHRESSGVGCAMNVVSYEQNDRFVTDFPRGVARPLALAVAYLNDNVCNELSLEPDRHGNLVQMLCQPCSMAVLDVAHRTIDTEGTDADLRNWVYELLTGTYGLSAGDRETTAALHVMAEMVRDGHWCMPTDALAALTASSLHMGIAVRYERAREIMLRLSTSALIDTVGVLYQAALAEDGRPRPTVAHKLLDAWEAASGTAATRAVLAPAGAS